MAKLQTLSSTGASESLAGASGAIRSVAQGIYGVNDTIEEAPSEKLNNIAGEDEV